MNLASVSGRVRLGRLVHKNGQKHGLLLSLIHIFADVFESVTWMGWAGLYQRLGVVRSEQERNDGFALGGVLGEAAVLSLIHI